MPLAVAFTMIFSPMQPCRWRFLHRCDNLLSPWGGRGADCEITTRPIFAPNRLGSVTVVQCAVLIAPLRLFTGLGAAGWVLPPVVRRGEAVCPGCEAGRRASAAGPWMAYRRVPWDKGGNRGHPTQEDEQVGVKTFGDFGSFQSHSPSRAAAAKPRRGRSPRVLRGEAVPLRRGAAFARQCRYPPLTLTLSPKGRGDKAETPSRAAPSCPARRSRAIHTWDDIAPGNAVTHPSP